VTTGGQDKALFVSDSRYSPLSFSAGLFSCFGVQVVACAFELALNLIPSLNPMS
jgi:hypothetical protein